MGLVLVILNRHESLHWFLKKADKVLVTEDKCCDTVCAGYTCGKGWQADPLKARCSGRAQSPRGGQDYYMEFVYLYAGMIKVCGL